MQGSGLRKGKSNFLPLLEFETLKGVKYINELKTKTCGNLRVIANGGTTLRTLNRQSKFKQKANYFDNWTTSKLTLIADTSVFFIFPPHFF